MMNIRWWEEIEISLLVLAGAASAILPYVFTALLAYAAAVGFANLIYRRVTGRYFRWLSRCTLAPFILIAAVGLLAIVAMTYLFLTTPIGFR